MKDCSRDFSLYIHIPFCVSKCAYCDFLSFTDQRLMAEYFDAICNEIRLRGREVDRPVNAIYVGGGTPSICYRFFPKLSEAIRESFVVKEDAEISMECNPESVTSGFIEAARAFGVNRVSLGVQTLSDPLLRSLGRAHDRKKAIAALELLTRSFSSVNADLMVGLPGQTEADVDDSLDVLLSFPLNHVSCYSLILEEGTPLFSARSRGEFTLDEDAAVDLYDHVKETLDSRGFHRYEISNFCKEGAACRYNLSVWQYARYLGVGLGASSFLPAGEFFPARRTRNATNLREYLASVTKRSEEETIEFYEAEKEFIMLGLRLEKGLDLMRFRELFKIDFLEKYREKIDLFAKYFTYSDRYFAIRPEYIYISNSLILSLIG